MRRDSRILFAAALCAAFTGCAAVSDDCDPTTGGLIGAIGCDTSGRYDQRLQERQSQQASLLNRKAELIKQQQELEAQQAAVATQLGVQEATLARAERELGTVRRRLQSEQSKKKELEAEAKALERQVAGARSDIAGLKQVEAQRQARIAELQREQRNLTKEYEAATGK